MNLKLLNLKLTHLEIESNFYQTEFRVAHK